MISEAKNFKQDLGLKLEELFGLDLRSLAVFRIGLGLLLIIDLIDRSRDLKAHYTDFGILPRAPLIEKFLNHWFFSFHLFSGEAVFQGILFVITGLIALLLIIGYRTKLVTIISWVLLISLHARNPMILNAGDVVLRLLLFWGMFLPLGAYYSVDSALNSSETQPPQRILSGATLALTLQICFIYWFTAILKDSPIWWKDGTAVYYALNIDQLVTPVGHLLLYLPWPVLVFFNFSTLWVELLGPFLLFVPLRTSFFRCCAVVTFILLHTGFRLGLFLGLFPFICGVAWLVFLPSDFWNKRSEGLQTSQRQGLRIYYDGECGFCKKGVYLLRTFLLLPQARLIPAQDDPEILADMESQNSWVIVDWQDYKHFKFEAIAYVVRLSPLFSPFARLLKSDLIMSLGTKGYEILANNRRHASKLTAHLSFRPLNVSFSWPATLVTLFFLVSISIWNLNTIMPSTVKVPDIFRITNLVLRLDQKWGMFSPFPLIDDGWYVIPGNLKDGTQVDLFNHGKPVSWEKPKRVSATYPNQHWSKYMMNLWAKDNAPYRLYYGQYLCRNWNSQHTGSKQLDTFKIYYMLEKTLPNYQKPNVDKVVIWNHYCFKKADEKI